MLLDNEDRVLLLAASDPANAGKEPWWEIPGGGVEGDEPSAIAAARELYEETGIAEVEMGPCVWTQHVQFDFAGLHFDQQEWVHVARCDGGVYRPAGLESLEALAFAGARWWPLAEVRAGQPARLLPPWLPEQLPAVLAAGLPDEPIDLGEVPSLS